MIINTSNTSNTSYIHLDSICMSNRKMAGIMCMVCFSSFPIQKLQKGEVENDG